MMSQHTVQRIGRSAKGVTCSISDGHKATVAAIQLKLDRRLGGQGEAKRENLPGPKGKSRPAAHARTTRNDFPVELSPPTPDFGNASQFTGPRGELLRND